MTAGIIDRPPMTAGTGTRVSRVLIIDDSAVARAVLARAIVDDPRFVVAREVADVRSALAVLACEPVDIILLDLELPGTDGLTALPGLIAASDGARVVIVSGSCVSGAIKTIRALSLGAADTLAKPASGALGGAFAASLLEKLARFSDGPADAHSRSQPSATATGTFDAVAIGASTGGIHALGEVLAQVPSSFDRPIVVTQHLPTSFTPYFAAQVALLAGRPCDVASDRMRLRAGRVVIAPGDAHVTCVALPDGGAAIRLSAVPAETGCMPSVDPMFATMASVFGPGLLAVVLSGMGRDGTAGAARVRAMGGTVVAQDSDSSVVWGMPGAVVAAGLADAVLDPPSIGRMIAASGRSL